MPHVRRTTSVAKQPILQVPIPTSRALMLAEVFRTGADEKCFDVDIWMFDIAEDAPARCAVSTPDSPVLVHRPQKLFCVLLIDEVLDRHEHGALLERRRDVVDDRRYAP